MKLSYMLMAIVVTTIFFLITVISGYSVIGLIFVFAMSLILSLLEIHLSEYEKQNTKNK